MGDVGVSRRHFDLTRLRPRHGLLLECRSYPGNVIIVAPLFSNTIRKSVIPTGRASFFKALG